MTLRRGGSRRFYFQVVHDTTGPHLVRNGAEELGQAGMKLWCRGRSGNLDLLPRKFLDASNGGFERLLRTPDVGRVRIGELLPEFVAGKIVNGLAQVLGAVTQRVDHAGDDERELDLVGSWLRRIAFVRYQDRPNSSVLLRPCLHTCRLNQFACPEYGLFACTKFQHSD